MNNNGKNKKNVLTFLRCTTTTDSQFNYGVIYGLLSIMILFVKQIITVFTYDLSSYTNHNLYWVIFCFILVLFTGLIIIQVKQLTPTNKYASLFVEIYPFLFIVLGLVIVSIYKDYNNRLFSYISISFILFWIQIYNLKKRLIVFGVASAGFIGLSWLKFGQSANFQNDLKIASMLFFLMFIASTILHQIHFSHQGVIKDLNTKNKNIENQNQEISDFHSSLRDSMKITETMLDMTQEVLQNESIEDVLQIVLDKSMNLIPHSQAGSILMADYDSDNLKYVAANGYDLAELQKVVFKKNETFQSAAKDKFEPFVVNNIKDFNSMRIGKEKSENLKNLDHIYAKACLTCSFKYNDEFFGSINIDNFDDHNIFTENDLYLIKQLAQELEIIISVHKLYEKAIRPTKYDELTQAKTRRYCVKLLRDLIKNHPTEPVSIFTIDINNLKEVNDEYGHDVGDKYLFEFAEAVRNSKIEENIFGRIGGDEFLLIFRNQNQERSMEQIQVIRDYLHNNTFVIDGNKTEITFAAGVAIYTKDSKDVNELIKLSDKRMYIDKNIQKNK